MTERIRVEVAYAEPDRQFLREVELEAGSRVVDAIERSGLRVVFPMLDPQTSRVGVFSRPATLQTTLHDGDRVEIYRPLQVDPKQVRRDRAAKR
ncbi:MAG: RnfH family protein [Tahibacter sp.]